MRFKGRGMTSQRTRDRLVARLRTQGIRNEDVLGSIANTPRHIFVDEALATRAYENTALPIGHGQTISQPYIVARMTEAVVGNGRPGRILEVGTGCGYQTAVLAGLADKVYSVERLEPLVRQARERIHALGLLNVSTLFGDGYKGWPSYAPFDGILVAAAPGEVPAALLEQLAFNGRLVIPVGRHGVQELLLITRTESGYEEVVLDSVVFVPMLGGTGQ